MRLDGILSEVIERYCQKISLASLKATFREPLKAIEFLNREKVDLIFLDINMPDIIGMQLLQTLSPRPLIFFTTAYSQYAVESYELSEILYLEKDGNYITLHLKDSHILIRENMGDIFDLLPAADFIRAHKSYVVGIKHISMIEVHQLIVNGEKIPIGSTYRDSLRNGLGIM